MVCDELMMEAIPCDDLIAEFDEVTASVFVSVAFHLLQFFGEWMD
jgi:hypothetical protein